MTPSINRLHYSAKALGEYIMEAEFDLVKSEFDASVVTSYEQFARWVTGYMYYHTLVCASSGDLGAILSQLQEDYDELVENEGDGSFVPE